MNEIKTYFIILLMLFGTSFGLYSQKSFSQQFGEYTISWEGVTPFIKIVHDKGTQGYLKWTPGGGAQLFLNADNITDVVIDDNTGSKKIELKGSMSVADYTINIVIPDLSKGDVSVSLDLSLKESIGAGTSWLSNANPEWELVSAGGSINQPVYYFNGPIPLDDWAKYSTMDRWFDRADLNQLIYFGDNQVLNSTLLLYEDFTSMDNWFELSGNNIVNKFELWEKHVDDIIRQPPGSLNIPESDKYEFGLVLQPSQNTIPSGSEFILSSVLLSLKPGSFEMDKPSEYSERFIESYTSIYKMVTKPEAKYYDWVDLSGKLVTEMEEKGKKNLLTTQHFNMKPMLQYFDKFDRDRVEFYSYMAHKETASSLRPNFKNAEGIGPGFGWMDDWNNGAAKVDFWQGYFWPIIQCAEYAIRYNDSKIKRDVISTIPLSLATIEPLDYTFSVFVDMNKPEHIISEYNFDFGGTGGIMYMLLLYRDLLLEDKVGSDQDNQALAKKCLDGAVKGADKLISFGFNSGFELNVTAASAWALYRLYEITGEQKYLDGINTQLAVILKQSWLFNPQYRQFKDRDIFLQSSARANISYSNAAEEIMMISYLEQLLKSASGKLNPTVAGMASELVRWKCSTIADGIPALHADKSVIYQGVAEHWGEIDVDSYVPLEPYGYNGLGTEKGLGYLAHCYYGLGVIPQAALTQFHKLKDDVLLYTAGPVHILEEDGKIYVTPIASLEEWDAFISLPAQTKGKYVYVNGFPIDPDAEEPDKVKFKLHPSEKHEIVVTDLPFILQQPVSQEVSLTEDAGFEIVVNGDNISYQWYKDEEPLEGAVSSEYLIDGKKLKLADAGQYHCIMSNGRGSVKTDVASLKVNMIDLVESTEINDNIWDIENPYLVEEGYPSDNISLKVNTIAGATVWRENAQAENNTFSINVSRPSIQQIEYIVKAPNGTDYLSYDLSVEKRFDFDAIVITRWNNTLIVNNNSATNGGYDFIAYKWFKNNEEIGSKQYYSAGPQKTDILDNQADYCVNLITPERTVLRTWEKKLSLKGMYASIHPNPANAGETVTVEVGMDSEMIKTAKIEMYNLSGNRIANYNLMGENTPVVMPSIPGTYIVRVKSDNFTDELKAIVK